MRFDVLLYVSEIKIQTYRRCWCWLLQDDLRKEQTNQQLPVDSNGMNFELQNMKKFNKKEQWEKNEVTHSKDMILLFWIEAWNVQFNPLSTRVPSGRTTSLSRIVTKNPSKNKKIDSIKKTRSYVNHFSTIWTFTQFGFVKFLNHCTFVGQTQQFSTINSVWIVQHTASIHNCLKKVRKKVRECALYRKIWSDSFWRKRKQENERMNSKSEYFCFVFTDFNFIASKISIRTSRLKFDNILFFQSQFSENSQFIFMNTASCHS